MGEEAADEEVGDEGPAETEVDDWQRAPSDASEMKRGEVSGDEAAEAEAEEVEKEQLRWERPASCEDSIDIIASSRTDRRQDWYS